MRKFCHLIGTLRGTLTNQILLKERICSIVNTIISRIKLSFSNTLLFQKVTGFLLVLFASINLQAQLDNIHYLPPMKDARPDIGNAVNRGNEVHLSTPITTPFDVEVYFGNSTTPDTILTGLSQTNPIVFDLFNPANNGSDGRVLLLNEQAGFVLDTAGMRFESSGDEFYLNYRIRSTNQSDFYTSKGQNALGTNFRWGGIPNQLSNADVNSSLGIYATENGTTVTIFGYDPATVFRQGINPAGITGASITITLDAGETYVLEAISSEGVGTVNRDGWLGATIISNNPIALSKPEK